MKLINLFTITTALMMGGAAQAAECDSSLAGADGTTNDLPKLMMKCKETQINDGYLELDIYQDQFKQFSAEIIGHDFVGGPLLIAKFLRVNFELKRPDIRPLPLPTSVYRGFEDEGRKRSFVAELVRLNEHEFVGTVDFYDSGKTNRLEVKCFDPGSRL